MWQWMIRSCCDFPRFLWQCRSAAVAGSQPLSLLMNQSHNVAQTDRPAPPPSPPSSTVTHRYAQRQRMTVIKISCSGVLSSFGQTAMDGDGLYVWLEAGKWGIWHSCASPAPTSL